MNQYLLSIYQPDGDPPPPDALEEITRDTLAVRDEARAAGVWMFTAGLHPASSATVVDPRLQDMPMTDGPYVEGKEHLGGFTVISVPDRDAAVAWGQKLAGIITLPVEVRPTASGSD
jgi:hypothetical protein